MGRVGETIDSGLQLLPSSTYEYLMGIEFDCYAGLSSEVWVERNGERLPTLAQERGVSDEDLNRSWGGLLPGDKIHYRIKTVPNMGEATNPSLAQGRGDIVSVNYTQSNWKAFERMFEEAIAEAPEDKKDDIDYLWPIANEKFDALPINQQRLILSGSGEKTTSSWNGIYNGVVEIPWDAVEGDLYNLGIVYGYSQAGRSSDEDKIWERQQELLRETAWLIGDVALLFVPFGAIFKAIKLGSKVGTAVKWTVELSAITLEIAHAMHLANEQMERYGIYAGNNAAGCGFSDTLTPLVNNYAFIVGVPEDTVSDESIMDNLDKWLERNPDKAGLFVLGASVFTIAMLYQFLGGGE